MILKNVPIKGTGGGFLGAMVLSPKGEGAIQLSCHNQATREIANNHVQHGRTKYVEVDRYFIKGTLVVRLLDIPFVRVSLAFCREIFHFDENMDSRPRVFICLKSQNQSWISKS
ncbi:unnamed protein product [Malus baccata var. baccata]